jgi:hypothetical protein
MAWGLDTEEDPDGKEESPGREKGDRDPIDWKFPFRKTSLVWSLKIICNRLETPT